MSNYEVNGHEVLLVETITTDNQVVTVKKHYTFFKHVNLTPSTNLVTISLRDYLGNPLPYEPVSIRITGESALGEALEPYEGLCEDGTIELDGYETGDKLTIETLNQNVENATLEVVI